MKWGHFDTVKDNQKLLYWALTYVLRPYFEPIDRWLKDILGNQKGLGGDPGWEIRFESEENGKSYYYVWADPEMSGIEPCEANYPVPTVLHAIKELLMALVEEYPDKKSEVDELIQRYKL